MTRWNIVKIAFYGLSGKRRTVALRPDEVAILTGRSGTGKSAVISAIDYCLGSRSCELPDYVRRRTIGVAVHWTNGQTDLIVGRVVPDSGVGTEKMFVQSGRSLSLPKSFDQLEGPAPRATARKILERALGIADIEDADSEDKTTAGKATIRHVTPYLFLTADVIISNRTILHDLDDPDKAKDIKATIPYFLQAIDQETVAKERRLRRLEAQLTRFERQSRAQERARTFLRERGLALLSQAADVGMFDGTDLDLSEEELLSSLRSLTSFEIKRTDGTLGGELGRLEEARRGTLRSLSSARQRRDAMRKLVQDASGFESTASAQFSKLQLASKLKLDKGLCPVCHQESELGAKLSNDMGKSLSLIEGEVAAVKQVTPELMSQLEEAEASVKSASDDAREIEAQIRVVIQQNENLQKADDLAQARAMTVGRITEFLDTTAVDYREPQFDIGRLLSEIEELRDAVDPQALKDRISNAENMISNYATEMLKRLPSTEPLSGARIQFIADGRIRVIEPKRQRSLRLVEVGSDQNYLAIHLALIFALHRHFEYTQSPVPGLIVIDQISRPYYPEDEKAQDERNLGDMARDEDRQAMNKIADFIFDETSQSSGLQVFLIEHAYIEDDRRYREATVERWTKDNNVKLIPDDWAERDD